jgi:hypothetical protein
MNSARKQSKADEIENSGRIFRPKLKFFDKIFDQQTQLAGVTLLLLAIKQQKTRRIVISRANISIGNFCLSARAIG